MNSPSILHRVRSWLRRHPALELVLDLALLSLVFRLLADPTQAITSVVAMSVVDVLLAAAVAVPGVLVVAALVGVVLAVANRKASR